MTLNPFPMRLMRGQANGQFHDQAEIWRNVGYGWELVGMTKVAIHHRLTPPIPGDPTDATAASLENVEIHAPREFPIFMGDHIKARGTQWTVGGGNLFESYGTFQRILAARPIAATPLTFITLRRWNPTTEVWQSLNPQLVHIAWQKSQPDRLGGVAIRRFGFVLPPEGGPDLDIIQGDSFFYGGFEHVIQWVPPDPSERREAIFWTNTGEGS